MRKFFKRMLTLVLTIVGSILGTLLAMGLILWMVLGIAYLYYVPKEPKLNAKTVLRISLNGALEEEISTSVWPFQDRKDKGKVDLLAIRKVLLAAQTDDRIAGVYLDVNSLMAGWALLGELRALLQGFKASGKFVIAYAENYTPKTYYIASLADEVICHPEGDFLFTGLSMTVRFYKGLFDKLGVVPEVFRVGSYKSAVEPFINSSMSPASKEQMEVLLASFYDQFMQAIAAARNVPLEAVKNMAHTLAVSNPQEAQKAGLITHVGYFNEFEDWIRNKLGLEATDKVAYVDYRSYYQLVQAKEDDEEDAKNKIAVFLVRGDILNFSNPGKDTIVASKCVKILRRLKKDPTVKAIVLRVNSPGGSSIASSTLWKELMLTKEVKPIVASMADVAASGGYEMAAACNYIMAHPTTITGSIGIYGMYFDIHAALQSKLGISFGGVKTGPSADMFSLTRSFTDAERKVIQRNVEHGYTSFVNQVAIGRHKQATEIYPVAQGRVWSGTLAQKHGLVDQLGDLQDAIKQAASLADLKQYEVTYVSQHKPKLNKALKELINYVYLSLGFSILKQLPLQSYYEDMQSLMRTQGVQARLPYVIEIQ